LGFLINVTSLTRERPLLLQLLTITSPNPGIKKKRRSISVECGVFFSNFSLLPAPTWYQEEEVKHLCGVFFSNFSLLPASTLVSRRRGEASLWSLLLQLLTVTSLNPGINKKKRSISVESSSPTSHYYQP